ncbi:MAG: CIA30 family protein [Oleiphilaceae bacterium]|nr:CIA30 family protein [Oleiphilaceae bacterium]
MNSQSTQHPTLLDFSDTADEPEWQAINDNVMGGQSQGEPAIRDGMLHFTGAISLENNGGFSSVRGRGHSYDLSGASGLILRVKGDGRTYQLRLYTSAQHQGSRIGYSKAFPTQAGEWIEVAVPFAGLEPVYRGRRLAGPGFDPSDIQELGFLLADKRPGEFELTVDWIKVAGPGALAQNPVEPRRSEK